MLALAPELVALLAKRGKPARTSQILLMQKVLLASATSPAVKPADQAKCALAWERLEERAMILRGYGKPKPVEARNATPRGKRKSAGPVIAHVREVRDERRETSGPTAPPVIASPVTPADPSDSRSP